jgi:hypothetical protein
MGSLKTQQENPSVSSIRGRVGKGYAVVFRVDFQGIARSNP